MGVYHSPKLRGKQWVCTLTVNKIKAISLHDTEKEAYERYTELEAKVDNGVFIDEFRKDPLCNLKFGPCVVDEGKTGERCTESFNCYHYEDCLKQACKYDLKGWRIHDTALPANAIA